MVEEVVGNLEQGLVRTEVLAELGDQLRIQTSISVRLIDRKSEREISKLNHSHICKIK
jgi:hypothetical protein